MIKLPEILPEPKRPINLPGTALWLSGEGAGSWFVIEEFGISFDYKIIRYSPDGNVECEGTFTANKKVYLEKDHSITYPSHCATVTLIQSGQRITLRTTNC